MSVIIALSHLIYSFRRCNSYQHWYARDWLMPVSVYHCNSIHTITITANLCSSIKCSVLLTEIFYNANADHRNSLCYPILIIVMLCITLMPCVDRCNSLQWYFIHYCNSLMVWRCVDRCNSLLRSACIAEWFRNWLYYSKLIRFIILSDPFDVCLRRYFYGRLLFIIIHIANLFRGVFCFEAIIVITNVTTISLKQLYT